MKLKYFLRGLGVGIFITALVLSISHRAQTDESIMTDQDIISEAEKLGMVMAEESSPSPSETPAASETPESTEVPEASESPESSESPEPSQSPDTVEEASDNISTEETTDETTEDLTNETTEESNEEPQSISITIEGGMWSEAVASVLANAGLVDNADDFNDYMKTNEYASKIRAGTYDLQENMTYDEIASKIMGR